MVSPFKNTYYGWYVVFGCAMVVLGVSGGQFSFGVFLQPMTEEFGWSRGTLSLAFGITYMISGLLRPLAGYLADRYDAKWAALSGVVIMGCMLLLLPMANSLWHLYLVFGVMSTGITLGTGPILTKIVSQWFLTRTWTDAGHYRRSWLAWRDVAGASHFRLPGLARLASSVPLPGPVVAGGDLSRWGVLDQKPAFGCRFAALRVKPREALPGLGAGGSRDAAVPRAMPPLDRPCTPVSSTG